MVAGVALVFVHSPLVGPLTWRAVADLLQARGWNTCVADLAGALDAGPPYYPALARRVAGAYPGTAEGLVLIGHSFSGALLPSIGAATAAPVVANIYVDAGLPQPGKSWFDTVPVEFAAQVRGIARDGFLPPWHEWFPPDAIAEILPDRSLREQFTTEIRGMPLALFEERLPDVPDRAESHGYLLLSQVYAAPADEAEQLGWPTVRESADHLAMLTRPKMVAARLVELLEALGIQQDQSENSARSRGA